MTARNGQCGRAAKDDKNENPLFEECLAADMICYSNADGKIMVLKRELDAILMSCEI